MQTGRRRGFQPGIECLEDRSLMAAHLTATLSNGLLRVDGTAGADHIVIRQKHNQISVDGTVIKVRGQGSVASVSADSVNRVEVRGLEGDDFIQVGGDSLSGSNALLKPTRIWGGAGNDVIVGSQGDDRIHGDDGNDTIHGRCGNDTIFGDAGNDSVYGDSGNDRLDGGPGTNLLKGGSGNDTIYSRSSHDTVDGGTGQDVAYFLAASAPRAAGSSLASAVRNVEVFNHPASVAAPTAPAVPFATEIKQLINLTNAYRASKHLPQLTVDSRLTGAAQYQAAYMARTGHYAHDNLDGRTLADRVHAAGYSFSFVAENIHLYDPAIRRTFGIDHVYQLSELAHYFLDGWKVSPDHNANLLSTQVVAIGVGMAQDRNGRIYASMVLGHP